MVGPALSLMFRLEAFSVGRRSLRRTAKKPFPASLAMAPSSRALNPPPGSAGRAPSYIVRQLYDFKTGARAGEASELMKPVVEKLSIDDMISLAAYLASLNP